MQNGEMRLEGTNSMRGPVHSVCLQISHYYSHYLALSIRFSLTSLGSPRVYVKGTLVSLNLSLCSYWDPGIQHLTSFSSIDREAGKHR